MDHPDIETAGDAAFKISITRGMSTVIILMPMSSSIKACEKRRITVAIPIPFIWNLRKVLAETQPNFTLTFQSINQHAYVPTRGVYKRVKTYACDVSLHESASVENVDGVSPQ